MALTCSALWHSLIYSICFRQLVRWLLQWRHRNRIRSSCCLPEVGPGPSTSSPASESRIKCPTRCPNSDCLHDGSCSAYCCVLDCRWTIPFTNGLSLLYNSTWRKNKVMSRLGLETIIFLDEVEQNTCNHDKSRYFALTEFSNYFTYSITKFVI